ncbi:MAG TPA: FkbM family methyltransferase [Patescibacteria group bacterium]|nr:FkbM family methyltransferase [Patescibacteria group bacterium]
MKKGTWNFYLAEIIWIISRFVNPRGLLNANYFASYCETKFGKFYINPDLITNIAASPAFERPDINYLFSLIKKDVNLKKSILFIDVGAYFGLYTVAVANQFKKYKKIDIISFEPGSEYLSLPTYELLEKNTKINHAENVKLYHIGLGDKNTKINNRRGIKTVKLDSLFNKKEIKKYDSIFMKIDVDGSENEVLRGATSFIKDSPKLTILIEDFVDRRIIKILRKQFLFDRKLTPYNSFWYK